MRRKTVRIAGGDLAVDVVLVDDGGVAVGVAQGNDAAQAVEVVVIGGVAVAIPDRVRDRLDHADGLIDAGAVDVLVHQAVIAVVLGDAVAWGLIKDY
jgi:hypothetical protein